MVLGEGVFQAKGTAQPGTGAESAQFGQNRAGVVRGPESAARGALGGGVRAGRLGTARAEALLGGAADHAPQVILVRNEVWLRRREG